MIVGPESLNDAAQHVVLTWLGGVILSAFGLVIGFNEWRHRMTVERLTSVVERAIEIHNDQLQPHPKALAAMRLERAELFGDIKESLHRIELGITKMTSQIEYTDARVEKLYEEHESQMRNGGHPGNSICAECQRVIREQRQTSPEEREEYRKRNGGRA